MSTGDAPKYWEKTRVSGLYRHVPSGRYYARIRQESKQYWKALDATTVGIAEAKPGDAKRTFTQAATYHMRQVEERVGIKKSTKKYWREIMNAVLKDLAELGTKEVRRIISDSLRSWAFLYATKVSPNRFNHSTAFLKHVVDFALEHSVIYSNPASVLERVTVRQKQPELPTRAQFAVFIAEMRRGQSRDSKNCADLAEGLVSGRSDENSAFTKKSSADRDTSTFHCASRRCSVTLL